MPKVMFRSDCVKAAELTMSIFRVSIDIYGDNMRRVGAGGLAKALRKRLKLRQEDLETMSGGLLSQGIVSKIEGGKNHLTGAQTLNGYLAALGLSYAQLDAYLSGKASLDATAALARPPVDVIKRVSSHPTDMTENVLENDAEIPLERAVADIGATSGYAMIDRDAARTAARESTMMDSDATAISTLASALLFAAQAIRAEGKKDVNTANIAMRAAAVIAQQKTRGEIERRSAEDNELGRRQLEVLRNPPKKTKH
jgi:transcriptional regulator with XRE-family HTH domain